MVETERVSELKLSRKNWGFPEEGRYMGSFPKFLEHNEGFRVEVYSFLNWGRKKEDTLVRGYPTGLFPESGKELL